MSALVFVRYVGPPGQVNRAVAAGFLTPGTVYALPIERGYLLAARSRHFELADGERDDPEEV